MPKGVSMLIIVLIIGAASLSLAVGSLWLGEGEKELAQVWTGAAKANLVAAGCLENALERLRIESSYSGEFLSLGSESCIITINKIGAPMTQASIVVLGTFNDYNKRLDVVIEVVGDNFNIISWQEN